MTAAETGLLIGDAVTRGVTARVTEIDGIAMSALCAEVDEPRAVVVAVHGGATISRYFDCPGRPWLSLLRIGAALGFTVLAVDRPGYGESAPYADTFADPDHRVDTCYRTIDAILGSRPRGAGVFLLAHSAGCDLALRMAAEERGANLLGIELAGTGIRKHPEAERRIAQMMVTRDRAAIREMLWEPEYLYPPEIFGGKSISVTGPGYEAAVVHDWPPAFPELARRVRVPVRFNHGEFERVWRSDAAALAEIRQMFCAAPRFVTNVQTGAGHNLSLGFGAAAYHLGVLSFVEECAVVTRAENPASPPWL
ncbi:alpha/beta hydrolase [Nocardia sp. NPDC052112]|uniref:alpha/beta hydrolase n=1 Tax=Nocardia sp. NPDC052112 TaxID=3155646 RepID=UPI0034278988